MNGDLTLDPNTNSSSVEGTAIDVNEFINDPMEDNGNNTTHKLPILSSNSPLLSPVGVFSSIPMVSPPSPLSLGTASQHYQSFSITTNPNSFMTNPSNTTTTQKGVITLNNNASYSLTFSPTMSASYTTPPAVFLSSLSSGFPNNLNPPTNTIALNANAMSLPTNIADDLNTMQTEITPSGPSFSSSTNNKDTPPSLMHSNTITPPPPPIFTHSSLPLEYNVENNTTNNNNNSNNNNNNNHHSNSTPLSPAPARRSVRAAERQKVVTNNAINSPIPSPLPSPLPSTPSQRAYRAKTLRITNPQTHQQRIASYPLLLYCSICQKDTRITLGDLQEEYGTSFVPPGPMGPLIYVTKGYNFTCSSCGPKITFEHTNKAWLQLSSTAYFNLYLRDSRNEPGMESQYYSIDDASTFVEENMEVLLIHETYRPHVRRCINAAIAGGGKKIMESKVQGSSEYRLRDDVLFPTDVVASESGEVDQGSKEDEAKTNHIDTQSPPKLSLSSHNTQIVTYASRKKTRSTKPHTPSQNGAEVVPPSTPSSENMDYDIQEELLLLTTPTLTPTGSRPVGRPKRQKPLPSLSLTSTPTLKSPKGTTPSPSLSHSTSNTSLLNSPPLTVPSLSPSLSTSTTTTTSPFSSFPIPSAVTAYYTHDVVLLKWLDDLEPFTFVSCSRSSFLSSLRETLAGEDIPVGNFQFMNRASAVTARQEGCITIEECSTELELMGVTHPLVVVRKAQVKESPPVVKKIVAVHKPKEKTQASPRSVKERKIDRRRFATFGREKKKTTTPSGNTQASTSTETAKTDVAPTGDNIEDTHTSETPTTETQETNNVDMMESETNTELTHTTTSPSQSELSPPSSPTQHTSTQMTDINSYSQTPPPQTTEPSLEESNNTQTQTSSSKSFAPTEDPNTNTEEHTDIS
eukprot:TRINITY_DN3514_c0_g4_i1.p1 TRINITY_DN3514_c0_g4~~TRINITY_DN3514_c0_g4_i1.p1  ORF type:complete len:914 (-),score=252.17 TRINITY_DN3514_c0_g4_i1:45-2786(-)